MDTSNKEFKPSDFWPEAEKMLDAHFNRKRAVKRWIFVSTLALLFLSFGAWWMFNIENKPQIVSEKTVSIEQKKEINQSNNSLIAAQNEANTTPEPKKESIENTNESPTIQSNNSKENKTSNTPNSITSSETTNRTIENEYSAEKTENVAVRDPNVFQSESIESKSTTTNRKEKKSTKNSALNTAPQSNLLTPLSNSTTALIDVKKGLENSALNRMLIKSNLLSDYQQYTSDSLMLVEVEIHQPNRKIKRQSYWGVSAYSGLFITQSRLTYPSNPDYTSKRTNEESYLLTNSTGINFSTSWGKWKFSSGFEYNTYGETTNYTNQVKGNIQSINTTPLTSIDTTFVQYFNYYQGNEYVQTQSILSFDTLMVSDTTTTQGWVTGNLPAEYSGGRNQYTYIEIPLHVSYKWIESKRWNSEMYGGVSLGIFQKARGFVPTRDLSTFERLEDVSEFRKTVWNFRFGIRANYKLGQHLSAWAGIEQRNMLQSIFTGSQGVNQRYRSIGVQVGVNWTF